MGFLRFSLQGSCRLRDVWANTVHYVSTPTQKGRFMTITWSLFRTHMNVPIINRWTHSPSIFQDQDKKNSHKLANMRTFRNTSYNFFICLGEFFCKESWVKTRTEEPERPPLLSRLTTSCVFFLYLFADEPQASSETDKIRKQHIFFRISIVIIHQLEIFSLARHWYKRTTLQNIFPNFQNCACCKNYLKDNKHNNLHLAREYARIFVLGHYLFLKAQRYYPRQISKHIFAPSGGQYIF